ncbi:hypothetical protein [uncultured Algoriphagus sp.]|uniref:hypothetical protein n=1 Tax=uncultured Algoriphagus sp. TaxID=417365 RepID=UPI0030ED550B|tara:strand:- start:3943 stop:4530 length:588 start_codon:yes stop_codon:yes gene_type:complete
MKTLLTVALASALSFSSFIANASEDLKALSSVNSNYKKINVTLNEGVGTAKISILKADGKILSSRNVRVKNENLMVPYDMNSLPAGDYQVKIVTDKEEVVYTVKTTERPIATADLPLMAYGKIIDENTVSLTLVGLAEPGVQVKVFSSESGKMIYEEKVDEPKGFKKNYSFNGVNSNEVYLELKDAQGRSKTLYF